MHVLRSRILADQQTDFQNCVITDEDETSSSATSSASSSPQHHYQALTVNLPGGAAATNVAGPPPILTQPTNRYSYRAAIYRSEAQQDLG